MVVCLETHPNTLESDWQTPKRIEGGRVSQILYNDAEIDKQVYLRSGSWNMRPFSTVNQLKNLITPFIQITLCGTIDVTGNLVTINWLLTVP